MSKNIFIVSVGEGRLKISHKHITDGTVWYKTISPYLLWKQYHCRKRDMSLVGKWLAVNQLIVWFKKMDNKRR
jgi:hypothetical protein